MTLAPSDHHPASALDLRCSGTTRPPAADRVAPARCQLLAGHDGAHAVMFSVDGGRRVLRWQTGAYPVTEDDGRSLPWTRGMPIPAWFAGERN